MNPLRAYDIHIVGLDTKRYEYDFTSDNTFFVALEQELIKAGNVQTHLVLEKSETMIRLEFHIVGEVEQICDRSLDEYNEPVDTQQTMLLKFGDHNEELSDEIELIERNTSTINVARYIFEFISLSLPMKRLHPRFRDEDDQEDDDQNGKLIYRSGETTNNDADDQTNIDPRWAALRKLSDN
ncbi:YceD family protein [Spirosoma flavum]|uniref:YceD family protein n=1 Tax=Spirosoma flavum TaxID=2048557 RepID=A0ABW6AUB9_9BACT